MTTGERAAEKVIKFPFPKRRGTIRRALSLPGFAVVTGQPAKVTHLYRRFVDEAFGLDWSAPLVIEFDDPLANNKRDIHVRLLSHEGKIWIMKWMDRTAVPGRKRYGLIAC